MEDWMIDRPVKKKSRPGAPRSLRSRLRSVPIIGTVIAKPLMLVGAAALGLAVWIGGKQPPQPGESEMSVDLRVDPGAVGVTPYDFPPGTFD
jgi:hypothetical protein